MNTAMRLRRARERAGLSQEQAALYSDLKVKWGKEYISKLENPDRVEPPVWDHLRRLTTLYRTNADYLLGLTNDYRPLENKTLPEGGSELLEYLVDMSDSARADLIAIAKVLHNSDQLRQAYRMVTHYLDTIDPITAERFLREVSRLSAEVGADAALTRLERTSFAETITEESVEQLN